MYKYIQSRLVFLSHFVIHTYSMHDANFDKTINLLNEELLLPLCTVVHYVMKYLHNRLLNYCTGHENKEVVILKDETTVLAVRQIFVVLNGV